MNRSLIAAEPTATTKYRRKNKILIIINNSVATPFIMDNPIFSFYDKPILFAIRSCFILPGD